MLEAIGLGESSRPGGAPSSTRSAQVTPEGHAERDGVGFSGRTAVLAGSSVVGSLVAEQVNVADGSGLGEAQPYGGARFAEEALASADDEPVNLQVKGIDEIVLDQRLRECGLPWTTMSPSTRCALVDLVDKVTSEDGGVLPLRVGQGLRDDVLRHGVELSADSPLDSGQTGASRRRSPTQKERVRGRRLVQLQLSPSGPREKSSVQPTRSTGSVPLGASTTPSTRCARLRQSFPSRISLRGVPYRHD